MGRNLKVLTEIRTDLALEAANDYFDKHQPLEGVSVDEHYDTKNDILTTIVKITSDEGAACLHKAKGTYMTLETPHLNELDENYHQEITEALMELLRQLVPEIQKKKILVAGIGNREITPDALGPLVAEHYHQEITEALMELLRQLVPEIQKKKILVAGIGNREITPDALGPLVAEHLFITRHLIKSYGEDSELTKGLGNISAIAPGVMAQTGMEGREIIEGIIKSTKPELLIVIDALAQSRSCSSSLMHWQHEAQSG